MVFQLALFSLLWFAALLQSPTEAMQRHDKAAQELQSAGKPDAAVAEYQAALAAGYRQLGKLFLAAGEYQQAAQALTQAVAYGNTAPTTLIEQATAFFYAQQYEQALAPLQMMLTSDGRNLAARQLLGKVYFRRGQFASAVGELERAATLAPNDFETSYMLALAYIKQQRMALARQIFERLLQQASAQERDKVQAYIKAAEHQKNNGQAVENFFRAQVNPPDALRKEKLKASQHYYTQVLARIHHQWGVLEAERQNFRAAIEQFRAAAHHDAGLRDVYYNWGLACYKAEGYQEAIPALATELKINPANLNAKHLLGMCYFMADDYAAAAATLREVLLAKPNNLALYYTLSLALLKQNKVEEASAVIQKMVQMSGDSPLLHILLGQAHSAHNEDEQALAELQKALAMDNKIPLAHFYTGLVYVKAGKFAEATQEFDEELFINPKDDLARYHLGVVLLASGKTASGLQRLREVIAHKPEFADARFELGKALLQQGDVEGATKNLEAAVKLAPDKAHIQYQLGRAYTAAGRDAEAQRCFAIFKQLKDKERGRTAP
ncbi:MAG: tetratricopeptide repeat protein [Acidobacteria bacterium]|nr:tetratricopeptide repeat protein [Acidobacteriota bacterium]